MQRLLCELHHTHAVTNMRLASGLIQMRTPQSVMKPTMWLYSLVLPSEAWMRQVLVHVCHNPTITT
jgi:hypothetical protein